MDEYSKLLWKTGGPDRDRTGDLLNAIQARSQLRYRPMFGGCRTPIVTRRFAGGTWAVTVPSYNGRAGFKPARARLYSGGCLTPVGERQPVGELLGGLIGGRPVKRHHGGRDARRAQQLCAPTIADGNDLYEVRPPANGFFEAMNGHGCDIYTGGGRRLILRFGRRRSSEARHEGGVDHVADAKRRTILVKKNLWWQVLNSFCTRHQQLFHNRRVERHAMCHHEGTMTHCTGCP